MRRKKTTAGEAGNDNTAEPKKPAKQALTITELCARWGCDRNVIYSAIKEKRLRAFKLGDRTQRVSITEVERYEKGEAA